MQNHAVRSHWMCMRTDVNSRSFMILRGHNEYLWGKRLGYHVRGRCNSWYSQCVVPPEFGFDTLDWILGNLWWDQAKSVWSRSNSISSFLFNCMHHFHSYILQKTPLKLVNWFQGYGQLNDANKKTFCALFGSILKSVFLSSAWFSLITSHMSYDPELPRDHLHTAKAGRVCVVPTTHSCSLVYFTTGFKNCIQVYVWLYIMINFYVPCDIMTA